MESTKMKILRIFEEDYGCEGVPDGEEPMCGVLAQPSEGEPVWLRMADRLLTEHGLDEGDTFTYPLA